MATIKQTALLIRKIPVAGMMLLSFFLILIAMLFIPLIRDLDYEYNAITALMLFIVSGTSTISIRNYFRLHSPDLTENHAHPGLMMLGLRESIMFVAIMIIVTVSVMTAVSLFQGCCPGRMYMFFLLLVLPSAVMGFSSGLIISAVFRNYNYVIWIIFLSLAFSYNLYLLFTNPPVNVYSVFFGYFAGPVYDDWIPIDDSLIMHAAFTLCLGIMFCFVAAGVIRQGRKTFINPVTLFAVTGISTFALMTLKAELYKVRTSSDLIKQLPGYSYSGHIHWRYDSLISAEAIKYLMSKGEYHYQDLTEQLQINTSKPISIYVYRDAIQKKKLIGAGKTNIARIWNDEIHINYSDAENVIRHEMTHLFANEFGHPLYGSASAALLEGLAVAYEDDYDFLTPHQWAHVLSLKQALPDINDLLGQNIFFTSSTGLSYTIAGSFCRFLIDRYGIDKFKKAYLTGSINEAYPQESDQLINEWIDEFKKSPIDSFDLKLTGILLQPSYTEKKCYHAVAEQVMLAREQFRRDNFPEAIKYLDRALMFDSHHLTVKWLKGLSWLKSGKHDSVKHILSEVLVAENLHPVWNMRFSMMYGDACVLTGKFDEARKWYARNDDQKGMMNEIYIESLAKRHLMTTDTLLLSDVIHTGINDDHFPFSAIREKKDSLLNLWAGQLYYDRERWNDAQSLLTGIAIADSGIESYRNFLIARCLIRQGNAAAAISRLDQAAERTRRFDELAKIRNEKKYALWLNSQYKGHH